MRTIIALAENKKILQDLFRYSTLRGLRFKIAGSTEEALAYFSQQRAPLFIVECTTAEAAALKFVRRLAPGAAVLAVSLRQDEETAISAFQNGAGGFLRLPCGTREFFYRLTNFIKLLNLDMAQENFQVITLGALKIYPQNNQVMLADEFVPLTPTEFKILLHLTNKLNSVVTTEELYSLIYTSGGLQHTSRALSVHMSKLRNKLHLYEADSDVKLATVHGKGYCLQYGSGGTESGYDGI